MKIEEGEVKICPPTEDLEYPGINSCLTVTAVYQDGSRVGAHLVRVDRDGKDDAWMEVLKQWHTVLMDPRTLSKIILAGVVGCWNMDDVRKGLLPSLIEVDSEKIGVTVDIMVRSNGEVGMRKH